MTVNVPADYFLHRRLRCYRSVLINEKRVWDPLAVILYYCPVPVQLRTMLTKSVLTVTVGIFDTAINNVQDAIYRYCTTVHLRLDIIYRPAEVVVKRTHSTEGKRIR